MEESKQESKHVFNDNILDKSTMGKGNPDLDHAIGGAISGILTRFICQPLDVVKIRLQLQVEPIKKYQASKYKSILQTFWLVIKEEGPFALWKGHVPAQLLSITYGTGTFYSYNIIMRYYDEYAPHTKQKHLVHFLAGTCAGSIGTIISFPFDTVRTRLVAQSYDNKIYKGILHSISTILRYESPKVFYFGLSPSLLQIAPHTGFQFVFYEHLTKIYKKFFNESETHLYNSLISGSIAGLIAKTIVYPMDLIRRRLQIQGFEHGRKGYGKFLKCKGLMSCVKLTLKYEGICGLFKGLIPSQVKAALTTALHFTFYEQTLLILKELR